MTATHRQTGNRTFDMNSGATSVPVNIATDNDTNQESGGSITVQVNSGTEYFLGSARSATVNVADDDGPPGVPGSLAAEAQDERVALTWTTAPSPSSAIEKYSYRVRRSDRSSWTPNWTDIENSGPFTVSYTATGLTNGQEYILQVRATNATGDGDPAEVRATPFGPPGQPEIQVIPLDRSLRATWSVSDDGGKPVNQYQVEWRNTGQSFGDASRQQTTTDQEYVIENLTNNTLYLVRVRASNDDGATYGHWSVVGRGRPFEAPAPEGFRAKWPTQTSVTLRWDALLDATEYILEQKKRSEGNGDWTQVEGYFDRLPSQSQGYQPVAVAAGLDCNTEYDFRLSAKHPYPVYEANDGISPHANTDGKTGPYPQDDQITNLLVTLEPNQASLSWAGPTDGNAAGYRVMRKTWDIDAETGERSNATETTVVQNSSHRDEQFQTYRDRSSGAGRDDKSYAYFVEALNADGEAYGLAHTGILRGGSKSVPEPVRNARLTYDTQSRRSMAWDAPPDPWLTTVYAAREEQMRNSAVTDPWRTTYQAERREFQWLDPAEREWYVPEYLDGSTFWTATMTVGSFGPETGFRSSGSQTYGTLSPDTFTHPTAGNFTVTQLQVLKRTI